MIRTSATKANSNIPGSASSRNQPSIIVYLTSHHLIAVGYGNVPRPRHICDLPTLPITNNIRSSSDAEVIFQYYATPIQRLVNQLGGGSPHAITTGTGGSSNTSNSGSSHTNRYIVLHDQGLYMNRYWKLAITRILQDVCNATYISFLSTLHMIPFAIVTPPCPIQTNVHEISQAVSSSSSSVVLSVHITGNEAQCMIYANGHHLEYTYQSCEYVVNNTDTNSSDANILEITVDDLRKRQERWLFVDRNNNENTTSPLIYAIALCLERCPVSVRKAAIQNLYFSGTIVVSQFQQTVALLLYQFLTTTQSQLSETSNGDDTGETSTTTGQLFDERINTTSPNTTMVQLTRIPINRTALRPLATFIAIIDNNMNHNSNSNDVGCSTITATTEAPTELIPWVGTSIYSTYWRCNYEQESGRLAKDEMNWIDCTIASTQQPNPWKKSVVQ